MKKIIYLMLFIFGMTISVNAQVHTCCHFDGYWSDWERADPSVSVYGTWDSYILFDNESGGKWNPQMKVTVSNLSFPKKKQRKKDMKDKKWYEFYGTVEYYLPDTVNDDGKPTTLYDIFKNAKCAYLKDETFLNDLGQDLGVKARKVTSNATIRIAAFENQPSHYTLWFDKVAVGVYFTAPNWKTFDD